MALVVVVVVIIVDVIDEDDNVDGDDDVDDDDDETIIIISIGVCTISIGVDGDISLFDWCGLWFEWWWWCPFVICGLWWWGWWLDPGVIALADKSAVLFMDDVVGGGGGEESIVYQNAFDPQNKIDSINQSIKWKWIEIVKIFENNLEIWIMWMWKKNKFRFRLFSSYFKQKKTKT